MIFRYRALDEGGKTISGVIDADSFIMAKERLRKDRVLVTKIEALQEKRREITLSPSQLLDFTRALGQLLRAGLPLYESLLTLEEKYRKLKTHPLFLDLCDLLKSGTSLSQALKKYPKTFDNIYICMVKAAEQTGSLPHIFEQLSLLISRKQKLKKQLISAISYPAFLASFCFIVVMGLLFFVIPAMSELFQDRELHPLTQIVLSASRFANHYWHLIGVGAFLLIGALILTLRQKKSRIFLNRVALKIPLLKTLTLEAALLRFCRSFGMLLAGGAPLLEALSLSKEMMNNALLESIIEKATKKVMEGKSLSSQLKEAPIIPSLVVRMLAISEETGRVAPMLQNIGDIYEEELEKNLNQLTAFLQPALLLLIGLIVGVVLLSILIPLTDVGSILNT